MFEIICLIIALFGSCLAGVYDLKTTEIPDWIPYFMILFGIILNSLESLIQWNFFIILSSITIGLGFLGLGFLMYYAGQWGGGDAKLLSAIGFLLPALPRNMSKSILPFPASFLFNLFLVGAAYMILYAFVLALVKRKILFKFFEDVKASYKIFTLGSIFLFLTFILLNFILSLYLKVRFKLIESIKYSLLPLAFTTSVFLLWKFAKVVEQVGFKQKIPVSKLKVGDVLENSKLWEGLNEKEVEKIKRSGKKYVVIKEGVRFAPAFPLALIFTLYFGDILLILLNLI